MKNKTNIYKYTDYRKFISDWIKREKEIDPSFSYRSFNKLVGIKSSSFLSLLINGSRNIGEEGINAIIKGFNLNERQANFFKDLVEYNQSSIPVQKTEALKKLYQYNKKAKKLLSAQYNLFSRWYYAAILELLKLDTEKKKDLQYILDSIKPTVGRVPIKKAIEDLSRLGLVIKKKTGYEAVHKMTCTPDEFVSIAVCHFHAGMSSIAMKSVLHDPAEEREFSSLTIAVSEKSYQQAKRKIQVFRRKLHEELENEGTGNKNIVCQLNFQQFKLNQEEENK